jgi:HK97 family phage portal protein
MSILQAAKNLRTGINRFFTTDVRSLERPTTPITSAQLADIFQGSPAASGVKITEQTALRSTVVLACVRVIAEAIASLPLHVFERGEDGAKAKARSHPLYFVLHDRPNDFMTSFTWRELAVANVLLAGNHFSEIQFGGDGQIRALWPLPTATKAFIERGRLWYLVPLPDGTSRVLSAERVYHVPGLGFDGISGKSVIKWGKEAIALSLAAEEFGARLFGNNANPGGIITSEKKLDDDAKKRLKAAWEQSHGGLDRAHRVAVLEEGLKWQQTGISPDDAQALETRKFQVSEIARLFRVPPHLIADVEKSTSWGTGIEQQNIGLVTFTLRPWLVRFEQTYNYRLFLAAERGRYFVEHNVDGLLRGDAKSRNEALAIQRQWGIINANEWRAIENMNPLDGAAGDTYLVPLNMASADQPPVPTIEPGSEPQDEEPRALPPVELRSEHVHTRKQIAQSFRSVFEDAFARIARRERNDILAEAKKALERRDANQFKGWIVEFFRDHVDFVRRQTEPVYRAMYSAITVSVGDQLGKNFEGLRELDIFFDEYVGAFAERHVNMSQADVVRALNAAIESGDDPLEALESYFGEYETLRTAQDVEWEVTRSENAFAKAAYAAAGVSRLIWRTRGDSCPYCLGLDGATVGIDESFIRAGEEYRPDDDTEPLRPTTNIGHPPAHRGCDCGIEHSM